MSKPVAVNKSNQSTPYYIRGVDLVDFLLSGNKSISQITLVDLMLVFDDIEDYRNSKTENQLVDLAVVGADGWSI